MKIQELALIASTVLALAGCSPTGTGDMTSPPLDTNTPSSPTIRKNTNATAQPSGGTSGNVQTGQRTGTSGLNLSDLPQPVQNTIQQKAPAAEIADIKKRTRNGQTVYHVSFKEPGKNPTIQVAEDGTEVQDLKKY